MKNTNPRTLSGIVTSNKADKTITVKISSLPIIIVRDNIHLAPLSNKK